MGTSSDEIGRLDMAARAVARGQIASSNRWTLLYINAVLAGFAILAGDRFGQPYWPPMIVICAVLVTVANWTDWRYKAYVPAIWFLIVALGSLVIAVDTQDSTFSRIRLAVPFVLLSVIYWVSALPFSVVNTPGWEKEKELVENWWQLLVSAPRMDGVIEFSTGSFWGGHYIYRLMKPGLYWAEAGLYRRFGKLYPYEFRIRKLSDVTFRTMPGGETKVRIGKRTMIATNLSPSGVTNL